MRPCFCSGSAYQQIQIMVTLLTQGVEKINEGYDFASAGSQKIMNGKDLTSAGDQVPKTNATLLLQWVSISTNSNNGDFAYVGSRENK